MKIKTVEILLEKVQYDFKWREKELNISLDYINKSSNKRKDYALRSGILLLYAHWEGYIKNIAQFYLIYVSQKRLKLKELNHSFIALALRYNLAEFEKTKKGTLHINLIKILIENQDIKIIIPTEGIIKTNSNLNHETLVEILATIGVDYTPYDLKKKLIDYNLLNNRNKIAHGEEKDFDEELFIVTNTEIRSMMKQIENQIINDAISSRYRKSSTQ